MIDSLGDRIKRYEAVSRYRLTPRSPVFIRVDGRCFHTYTRAMDKPFDRRLVDAMTYAAVETAREMTGFRLAYTQSDECTFLITDFDTLTSQGWFDYQYNKIVSLSASLFTAYFNQRMTPWTSVLATFDARAFSVPESDIANVFLWRQKDWARNSMQMLARSVLSHHLLVGKKQAEIHELLSERGINWADLDDQLKNGTFITRDRVLMTDVLPNYSSVEALLAAQMAAEGGDPTP